MSGTSPELWRALGSLAETPAPGHERVAGALGLQGTPARIDHSELFLLQLYPYASIHLGAEGLLGGEACDRIAGFWRALGREPPVEPDHLAALLGLYAALGEAAEAEAEDPARAALRREAGRALFWEHLASWLFPYLAKLREVAPPFYREWGRLLEAALRADAHSLGSPGSPPLHLRTAPPLPEPGEASMADLIGALLAPVRSGVILTRGDLVARARASGVGMIRVGERRFMIETLLAQEPDETLRWLAGEADGWALRHEGWRDCGGPLAEHWRGRARETARVLRACAAASRASRAARP